MKALPDKPSDMMAVAVWATGKARRSRKYILNMDAYHGPAGLKTKVDMAGAVMAFVLFLNPAREYDDDAFNKEAVDKFNMIEALRQGSIQYAFECVSIKLDEESERILQYTWRRCMEYPEFDYRKSMRYWLRFIKKLRELGY